MQGVGVRRGALAVGVVDAVIHVEGSVEGGFKEERRGAYEGRIHGARQRLQQRSALVQGHGPVRLRTCDPLAFMVRQCKGTQRARPQPGLGQTSAL